MEHKDINTIFTFASTLAFQMFENKQYSYTIEELHDFNNKYKNDIDFDPTFNIVEKLISSHILVEYEESYKFSHKYIYYYFVGYYFSQNIDDTEITIIIEKMTKRLYRTEFANILMFILHLSPKTQIITMLNNEAKKLFQDINEFRFDKEELTKIHSSIIKDTSQKLSNRSIEESREIELSENEKEDSYQRIINKDDQLEADYNEKIQQLNYFKKLNLAFKIMEILGEIVKNYSGSLKGSLKKELIDNTYGIGLRSLKMIITLFEDSHENLVAEIKKIIKNRNIVIENKINETVHGIIFGLASGISTDIIKRIVKAIASKDLKKTYKRISDNAPENFAYQLIKNAVDLEFTGGLNTNNIEKLHKELNEEKNFLTNYTLKKLILDHLYMYDVSIDKKNSICKKLNIDTSATKRKLISNILS